MKQHFFKDSCLCMKIHVCMNILRVIDYTNHLIILFSSSSSSSPLFILGLHILANG